VGTLVRRGNRVIVPDRSRLRDRVEVEAVQRRRVQHQVTGPVSVKSDLLRQVKILPRLAERDSALSGFNRVNDRLTLLIMNLENVSTAPPRSSGR
jgi:hypothetical protein